MKKTTLLLVIYFIALSGFAQITAIKKQLSELYFEINFPVSKYDIRKLMNSENFSKFSEGNIKANDVLISNFNYNYKLQYYRQAYEKQFTFWFSKGTDKNYCTGIDLRFSEMDKSYAYKQYDELISFFKNISYKTTVVGDRDEGTNTEQYYYFYSSAAATQKSLAYMIVKIRYITYNGNNLYAVTTSYYPDHLF